MGAPRPSGPEWVVTEQWIAWVDERMRALRISQRELAKRIKAAGGQATGAAISDLLNRKSSRSRLVPDINAALGGVPPIQQIMATSPVDEAKARIDQKWDKLDEVERQLVIDLIDRLTRSR